MKCPCGYITECPVWCGPGHETGDCPPHDIDDCPKYEWIELSFLGSIESQYVRGRCLHDDVVEVRNLITDELLRHLCKDCNTAMDAGSML